MAFFLFFPSIFPLSCPILSFKRCVSTCLRCIYLNGCFLSFSDSPPTVDTCLLSGGYSPFRCAFAYCLFFFLSLACQWNTHVEETFLFPEKVPPSWGNCCCTLFSSSTTNRRWNILCSHSERSTCLRLFLRNTNKFAIPYIFNGDILVSFSSRLLRDEYPKVHVLWKVLYAPLPFGSYIN